MPSSLFVVPRDGGAAVALPVVDLPILPGWHDEARRKGFEIAARVVDRLHLALRCTRCGCVSLSRVFTLRTARPICPNCLAAARSEAAEAAGVRFLRQEPDDTRYGLYVLPCGHEARRQFGLIARAASGETGIRCETCHAGVLQAEAGARDWSLVGPDPKGNPNYRLYAHVRNGRPVRSADTGDGGVGEDRMALPPCGHVQRIARGNMVSGRFTCEACGQGWPVAASALYVMGFELPGYGPVIKLGFSRDPVSRLQFQLRVNQSLGCAIRRIVPVASGHRAIRIEKRMHAQLRRNFPDAVIPPDAWAGQIRVRSEIYAASVEPHINAMLDRVETSPDESERGNGVAPVSGSETGSG